METFLKTNALVVWELNKLLYELDEFCFLAIPTKRRIAVAI